MARVKLLLGVVALATLCATQLPCAGAYQLRQLGTNPCVVQGNGTCFDISTVYDWPITLENGKYKYEFNPCKPVAASCQSVSKENRTSPVSGKEPGIAMCQSWHPDPSVTMSVAGGLIEPLYLWNGIYPGNPRGGERGIITVTFPLGAAWRNTVLTLRETTANNITVSMLGEAPLMQYNFEASGANALGEVRQRYPCK